MSEYTKCAWCGKTMEKNMFNQFLSHNTMGLAGRQKNSYCSKRCQREAEAAEQGNGSNSSEMSYGNSSNQQNAVSSQLSNQAEDQKQSKLSEIAGISFTSDMEAAQNSLNQLVAIAVATDEKEIRNAIIEKMEFGIMKLRSAGFVNEADYFESKREAVRPKSFFESTSNRANSVKKLFSKRKGN